MNFKGFYWIALVCFSLIFLFSINADSKDLQKVIRVNMSVYPNGSFFINEVGVSMGVPGRECIDCSGNYIVKLLDSEDRILNKTSAYISFNEEEMKYFLTPEEIGEHHSDNYNYIFLEYSEAGERIVVEHDGKTAEFNFTKESFRLDATTTSTVGVPTTTRPAEGGDIPMLITGGFILLLIVIIGLILNSRKKRRKQQDQEEKREEMLKWIEGQLRDGEDPERLKSVVRSQGFSAELVDKVERKLM